MTLKFCSLSSGSSGNCQYIETEKSKILIDGGFSGKQIEKLLGDIDVSPRDIDGIFVSHEHSDHIKGVGVLSRRYDIPIFANGGTWKGMEDKIGKLSEDNIRLIDTGENFEFRDLDILPIKVFHDSLEPVGYVINSRNKKISVVTDTGYIGEEMIYNMKGSNLILLESNHDVELLKLGSYPYYLKERVLSMRGHLSNEDAGRALSKLLKGEDEIVLLGHLSLENNMPLLAYETVKEKLESSGLNVLKNLRLDLTYRDRVTNIYKL